MRRALLVGVDAYPRFGVEARLAGAGHDVETMAGALGRFDFVDVVILRDAEATRAGILAAMDALLARTGPGDVVLFYFSGHGSQVTDREGDEGDGLDETIVPWDSGREPEANRDITDDELNGWTAALLATTPRVVLIFDCCHSATLHRPGWRVRAVPADLRPGSALPPVRRWPRDREIRAGRRPIALAACGDHETASELPAWVAGVDRGALSFHLVEELARAEREATWRQVFERARARLRRDVPEQRPTLVGDGVDEPLFGAAPCRRTTSGASLLAAGAPTAKGLTIRCLRSRGGPWRPAGDPPELIVGDRLRLDVRLDAAAHPRGRWLYVLDVGTDGTVELLFPGPDDHERLDPGRTLVVGARPGDRLGLALPDAAPANRREWTAHAVVVLANRRLDFASLLGEPDEPSHRIVVVLPYRLRRAGST